MLPVTRENLFSQKIISPRKTFLDSSVSTINSGHSSPEEKINIAHSFRYRIESMAIGHIGSHTTSHAESGETRDASTNKGLLFSTKEHFVQKNVSWGLFFHAQKLPT
ncbi:hypothetical protein V1478_005162 [Vespula squamosa]|uniref:Uncharacterized protein n=1 Tax=Vespula squamosa TaxID=30214 RepID=A0ABD2BDC3_VESSQ